jgi:hypothetical protein
MKTLCLGHHQCDRWRLEVVTRETCFTVRSYFISQVLR